MAPTFKLALVVAPTVTLPMATFDALRATARALADEPTSPRKEARTLLAALRKAEREARP